jgi:hypothetical protein
MTPLSNGHLGLAKAPETHATTVAWLAAPDYHQRMGPPAPTYHFCYGKPYCHHLGCKSKNTRHNPTILVAGHLLSYHGRKFYLLGYHDNNPGRDTHGNKNGEKRTIGNLIGFEVRIYNETVERVPQAMQEAMVQSRLDGSRRRVGYKASIFHTNCLILDFR